MGFYTLLCLEQHGGSEAVHQVSLVHHFVFAILHKFVTKYSSYHWHRRFTKIHWKQNRDPTFEEATEIFKTGGKFGFISWFSALVLLYLTSTFVDLL
jgi:hypothetical protein